MSEIKIYCRTHPDVPVEFWACDCGWEKREKSLTARLQEAEKVIEKCERVLKKAMECCGCDELYTGLDIISEYRKGAK